MVFMQLDELFPCFERSLRRYLQNQRTTSMDEDEQNAVSRRRMLGGIGAGMALAVARSALAQQSELHPSLQTTEPTMHDLDRNIQAPFGPQTQAWPGPGRNMNLKPNHGEETYRGSARLRGTYHRVLEECAMQAGATLRASDPERRVTASSSAARAA